ncbi:hypothetical protein D3C77_587850 [compost metagenome]
MKFFTTTASLPLPSDLRVFSDTKVFTASKRVASMMGISLKNRISPSLSKLVNWPPSDPPSHSSTSGDPPNTGLNSSTSIDLPTKLHREYQKLAVRNLCCGNW